MGRLVYVREVGSHHLQSTKLIAFRIAKLNPDSPVHHLEAAAAMKVPQDAVVSEAVLPVATSKVVVAVKSMCPMFVSPYVPLL